MNIHKLTIICATLNIIFAFINKDFTESLAWFCVVIYSCKNQQEETLAKLKRK